MSIDDEDLERAGRTTRSRRQNSYSKPTFNVDAGHHVGGKRTLPSSNRKSRWIIFSILFIILFFLFMHNYKLPRRKSKVKTKIDLEASFQFRDSSQLTDYALLNDLLLDNSKDDIHNSFAYKLSKGQAAGHTFDELRRLTNKIALPTTNSKQRIVPVTAMIHTRDIGQLYVQVQAVLSQTALAEHIWIICDTEQKAQVEARIMTLDKRRIKVLARDHANESPHRWLQFATHVSTEFVWLFDQPTAPGKRYLENLLKLSYTQEYKSALLGTEAALFKQDGVECMPYAMHSGSSQMKSQAVDIINDHWLLHRSWIPYILEGIGKEDTELTGLFISRVLSLNAGIPSIALPTDPIERAYWGDVRLQKAKKSETCKTLENQQNLHYRSNSTEAPVLIHVDSVNHFEELICGFKESVDLHIVTSQPISISCSTVVVHDIGGSGSISLLDRFTRILATVQPKVFIHSVGSNEAIFRDIKAATDIIDTTSIYIPAEDISQARWMTELPIDTLAKWNSFSIKIMINTDKKPHALARLLNSADNAYYLGDQVELGILMDETTDTVTQTLANNYNWKYGTKSVRHRIAPTMKAPLFVESWYPASNDEYAIILNNDAELSPYFYAWTKFAILKYRYMQKSEQLFGISLYAPRLIETDPSGRQYFNATSVLSKAGFDGHSPYLMQWPSSSGAVFFPEHWREFHDYITARLADNSGFEMQDISVPDLRSNQWTKSWRRNFEELIYLRGYVMLFPNFDGESLVTQYVELRKKAQREQFADAISILTVPLMQQGKITTLPEFNQLPVLDIWGHVSSHKELKERGSELQEEVSACPAPLLEEDHHPYDPTDLLCPFARIVSVTLQDEKDPLPELPTIDITVYN